MVPRSRDPRKAHTFVVQGLSRPAVVEPVDLDAALNLLLPSEIRDLTDEGIAVDLALKLMQHPVSMQETFWRMVESYKKLLQVRHTNAQATMLFARGEILAAKRVDPVYGQLMAWGQIQPGGNRSQIVESSRSMAIQVTRARLDVLTHTKYETGLFTTLEIFLQAVLLQRFFGFNPNTVPRQHLPNAKPLVQERAQFQQMHALGYQALLFADGLDRRRDG